MIKELNRERQAELERRQDNPFSKGLVFSVDKPLHWTSFDVVNKVRYMLTRRLGLKKLKVGHAGTLDPLATGVVVLCTGKATKLIEELQRHEKTYRATIQLGATTPSYDMETEIDDRYPTDHITEDLVRKVLEGFVGTIRQVPPTFSACKVDGKRAYEMARAGKDVELTAKEITIKGISLLSFSPTAIEIEVVCGKGTYIRALARDIGVALESGGYLSALRRVCSGGSDETSALKMEEVSGWIEEVMTATASR